MSAYYNEIDPYCVAWLRNLIDAGHLPPGDIDDRSIEQVHADDLKGYTQAHFFAGIGGWAHAARLAGWPDSRPLWTGSCPCPPFSNAGRRKICPECGWANPVPCPARTGYFLCCECEHQWHADDRHLWPEFWRLIRDRRPPVVAGEQVASADGRVWLAGVRGSLEILGYAVGASDLCAAGVSAPHLRQRLWWVADNQCERRERGQNAGRSTSHKAAERSEGSRDTEPCGTTGGGLADDDSKGRGEQLGGELLDGQRSPSGNDADGRGAVRGMGDAGGSGGGRHAGAVSGSQAQGGGCGQESGRQPDEPVAAGAGSGISNTTRTRSEAGVPASKAGSKGQSEVSDDSGSRIGWPWERSAWWACADGKARRIEPGIEPLVDGFPGRVDQVRAYGNAIVPQEAAEVLIAFDEARAANKRQKRGTA